MSPSKISSELQRFIFDNVDSIGFLEALLIFYRDPVKSWTSHSLAQELRNNPAAIEIHVKKLNALQLIRMTSDAPEKYNYDDTKSGFREIVGELAEAFRVQRHRVYELVYSPLKKARDFSDAFVLERPDNKKEDDDG